MKVEAFTDLADLEAPVRGTLHRTDGGGGNFLVLTHGAGGNSDAALLVALADAFAQSGLTLMREQLRGHAFVGGSSYGGRQASMLAASEPTIADGLLLLSYPLHPPGKPAQLRTQHFSELHTPTLFVSGSRDAFGTIEELQSAIKLIPAKTKLVGVEGAAHGLSDKKKQGDIVALIAASFREFFGH